MRREIRRVDSTGGHSGQHIGAKMRKGPRQLSENSDLVGGARTAAGQHEGQVRTLVWNAYSLRWKDPWPQMIAPRAEPVAASSRSRTRVFCGPANIIPRA